MDICEISTAKKVRSYRELYSHEELKYWSRKPRKATFRKIATDLVHEGVVARITPMRVKKIYYKLRSQYRRVQKKIHNLREHEIVGVLTPYSLDVLENMGFLRYYVHYRDSMVNK